MDSSTLDKFINLIENENIDAISLLKSFIKFGTKIVQNNKEFLEELKKVNSSYQVTISDVNFDFWVKILDGKIEYNEGIDPDAVFKIILSKNLLIKIIKQEITATEAYMKGLLKINGSLSHALKIRNFLRMLYHYLGYKSPRH